jgi:hypothetical protein
MERTFAAASVARPGGFVVARVAGRPRKAMRPAAPTRDFPGRPRKDRTTMQTKTALAVAGSVLAVPSTALAAAAQQTDSAAPGHEALRASGRLTRDAAIQERLVRTNLRLARREARLSGDKLRKGYARRVKDDSVSVIRAHNRRLRTRITRLERGAGSTASAPLQAIAACESGGDPSTNTGNGFYGKYQFTQSTWQSVGGTGNPAAASEAEQDRRAAMLYARAGSTPWPVCGQ